MKRRNLFTLGMLGALAAFTAACSDDEDTDPVGPRLDVTEPSSGADGGAITIVEGETVSFEWDARSGETDLQTFSIALNGVNAVSPLPETNEGYVLPYTISNAEDNLYVDGINFANAGSNVGTTDYTFTLTDGIGLTASVTFSVEVIAAESELSAAQNFEWSREAGADGEGLEQFGLKWTSNSSTNAIVAIYGNTTMHALPVSAWSDLTTQEDLATAIENGDNITQYTNVSVTETGTYNDVLGVIHNDTMYLINVQQGVVSTGPNGTDIDILGQYKL